MIITYPTLSLNPSSFKLDPKDKSLVSDGKYGLLYGRELYSDFIDSISVSYVNLPSADYTLLHVHWNTVKTILPFVFTFQGTSYNTTFQTPINISKEIYNYYDIDFILNIFYGSMEL